MTISHERVKMQEFITLYKTNKKELLIRLVAPLVLSVLMFFIFGIIKRLTNNSTIAILFEVFGILQFLIASFMVYIFGKYSLEEKAKRDAENKKEFERNHPRINVENKEK